MHASCSKVCCTLATPCKWSALNLLPRTSREVRDKKISTINTVLAITAQLYVKHVLSDAAGANMQLFVQCNCFYFFYQSLCY